MGAYRRQTWQPRILRAALLAGILAGAGCASMTKRDWLSLFFDGVPPPPGSAPASPQAQRVDDEGYPVFLRPTLPPPPAPVMHRHAPYADNTCTACHESKFSQGMKKKPKELCFSCHDNFLATAKVKHAPAEGGECLACHNPHQSEQKHLLLRKGKALCGECHDDVAKGKVKHAPAEAGECLACHGPHASEQKFLLLRKGKALCLECHDDVTAGKVKHAPAEEGACLDCHQAHAGSEPALLKKPGAALCYDCHDQKEVTKLAAHNQIGGASCTACHNPHSAGFKALLKTAPPDSNPGKGVTVPPA